MYHLMLSIADGHYIYMTPLSAKECKIRGFDTDAMRSFRAAYKKALVPLSIHGWVSGNPCSLLTYKLHHRVIYYGYPTFVFLMLILCGYFHLICIIEDLRNESEKVHNHNPRQALRFFLFTMNTAAALELVSGFKEWGRPFSENTLYYVIR